MISKSIDLSDEEAETVQNFADLVGEVEADVLKQTMLLGLQELRIERAIQGYVRDGDSAAAATIADLPRARMLDMLAERGVNLLVGPSTIRDDLKDLASI